MTTVFVDKKADARPFAIGRPRWENLLLIASLAVFWGGVILKIIG
jgi:hypothetical protein